MLEILIKYALMEYDPIIRLLLLKKDGKFTEGDLAGIQDKRLVEYIVSTRDLQQISVGSDVAMGEAHLRLIEDERTMRTFLEKLKGSQIIVIESRDIYPGIGYYNFMTLAQAYAEKSLPKEDLVVLDDRLKGKLFELWSENGVDLEFEDYLRVKIITNLQVCKNSGLDETRSVTAAKNLVDAELLARSQQSFNYETILAQAQELVFHTEDQVIQNDINTLGVVLNLFETKMIRDIGFHEIISKIKKESRGKSIVVVIGKEHTAEVVQALSQGQCLTEVSNAVKTAMNSLSNLMRLYIEKK